MRILSVLSIICLASCVTAAPPPLERVEGAYCQTEVFKIDADFPGANMADCAIVDDRTIAIDLKPEDVPINQSPWYAVRVTPVQTGEAKLILRYQEHPHRYKPKLSYDGTSWQVVSDDRVSVAAAGFEVSIDLELGSKTYFVSAQELITNAVHDAWMDAQVAYPHVDDEIVGTSIEGRAIRLLRTNDDLVGAKTVMLVGRQHPPEVTGALAMKSFMDELLSDSPLAIEFRTNYKLVMIPNLNPDGVEHGFWRHNLGGIDLNRDWGPFTQPETQAAKRIIDTISPDELSVFLDFHSTRENVFYTQPVGFDGTDYGFTAQWLSRAGTRLEDFPFSRQGAHNVDLPTSKTYIYERFGIPAITYELGDETDRAQIEATAKVFAQEMMRLLLEQDQ
jgi:hypothetical protein